MEVIHSAPSLDSFTPLATHQSQTPDSFYEGPPVLHYHTSNAQLLISTHDLKATPALAGLSSTSHDSAPNGHADDDDHARDDVVLQDIDVCVTSERFILFSGPQSTGLSIPYPVISLHAIQRLHLPQSSAAEEVQGLFLQISTSDGFDDHDVDSTVSLTVIPGPTPAPPTTTSPTAGDAQQSTSEPAIPPPETETAASAPSSTTEIQSLFTAVTNCSNLHPDPVSQDEDGDDAMMFGHGYTNTNGNGDGGAGLPPPLPGSGGWITAENMGEFFDEEGNWRGGTAESGGVRGDVVGLGPGAGVVRGRNEIEEQEGEGGQVEEGGGEYAEEGAGVGEETKWRRTG